MKANSVPVRAAFTLVELLVVIAIIAILSGMLLPSLAKAKQKGKAIVELNSAKQMMLAHSVYASEHDDRVLPAYQPGYVGRDPQGQPVTGVVGQRYPWRLSSYLGQNFRSMYVNDNGARLATYEAGAATNLATYQYYVSLFPSLGLNYYVGGAPTIIATGNYGPHVERNSDAQRGSDLIVFASTRYALSRDADGGSASSAWTRLGTPPARWPGTRTTPTRSRPTPSAISTRATTVAPSLRCSMAAPSR